MFPFVNMCTVRTFFLSARTNFEKCEESGMRSDWWCMARASRVLTKNIIPAMDIQQLFASSTGDRNRALRVNEGYREIYHLLRQFLGVWPCFASNEGKALGHPPVFRLPS